MDSYAPSNLLHRHPAHGDLCGHGVDFVDDTAGERFNVVHGNQSLPVVWYPIYQRLAALRRDQRVAGRAFAQVIPSVFVANQHQYVVGCIEPTPPNVGGP
jgi:hypothetical protein